MLQMKKLKKKNSAVLLAEGVEIGNQQTLSYQELSGVLGNLLSVIRSHRTGWKSFISNSFASHWMA